MLVTVRASDNDALNHAGLASGAFALTSAACVFTILSVLVDSYLVLRTELGSRMCWLMMGIRATQWQYGDAIVKGDACASEGMSTQQAYCASSLRLLSGDAEDFNAAMCQSTRVAKAMMASAIVLACATVVVASRHPWLHARAGFALVWFSNLVAAALVTAALAVVLTSPLFSRTHNNAISNTRELNVGAPFNGLSCSFQTPLAYHNPLRLFEDSALKCLMLGPSVALSAMGIVSHVVAAVLLGLMRAPALRVTAGSSMYATCHTRFHSTPRAWRIVLIDALPFVVMMAHAVQWVAFLWTGTQIVGEMDVNVVHDAAMERRRVSAAATEAEAAAMGFGTVHYNQVNIFNFTPVTSFGEFLRFGAYFVAIITLCTILILPLVRVVIFIVCWFAPVDATRRGLLLSLVDLSGKYMFANVFVLCVLGVAMDVKRKVVLPGALFLGALPAHSHLELVVKTDMTARSSGAWMFLLATMCSLVLSEAALAMHQACGIWDSGASIVVEGDDEAVLSHAFTRTSNVGVMVVTARGKAFALGAVGLALVWGAVALTVPSARIIQEGFSGDYVVDSAMRRREFSVWTLGVAVQEMGGAPTARPAVNYASVMCACALVHIARLLLAGALLVRRWSVRAQLVAINVLDMAGGWASLEVLVLVLAILVVELPIATDDMTSSATPRAAQLVLDVFRWEHSFFDARLDLLGGFGVLVGFVVYEKLVMHAVFAVGVACVVDRLKQNAPAVSRVWFSPPFRFLFFEEWASCGLHRATMRLALRLELVRETVT